MDLGRGSARIMGHSGQFMLRIGAIFIVICIVLLAGAVVAEVSVIGMRGAESTVVADAALTALALYSAVPTRLRDRSDLGNRSPACRAALPTCRDQLAEGGLWPGLRWSRAGGRARRAGGTGRRSRATGRRSGRRGRSGRAAASSLHCRAPWRSARRPPRWSNSAPLMPNARYSTAAMAPAISTMQMTMNIAPMRSMNGPERPMIRRTPPNVHDARHARKRTSRPPLNGPKRRGGRLNSAPG